MFEFIDLFRLKCKESGRSVIVKTLENPKRQHDISQYRGTGPNSVHTRDILKLEILNATSNNSDNKWDPICL